MAGTASGPHCRFLNAADHLVCSSMEKHYGYTGLLGQMMMGSTAIVSLKGMIIMLRNHREMQSGIVS